MRHQIAPAIAKAAEKNAVKDHRSRTRLGMSSPIKPSQIDFSREQLEEDIWPNKAGMLGVRSAGYCWVGAGAALFRVVEYLSPRQLALWLMIYADDG